jgi:hypothetical protein
MRVLTPPALALLLGLVLLFQQTPKGYFHDCDHGSDRAASAGDERAVDEDCALCDIAVPVLTTVPELRIVALADLAEVAIVPELPGARKGTPLLAKVRGPPSQA